MGYNFPRNLNFSHFCVKMWIYVLMYQLSSPFLLKCFGFIPPHPHQNNWGIYTSAHDRCLPSPQVYIFHDVPVFSPTRFLGSVPASIHGLVSEWVSEWVGGWVGRPKTLRRRQTSYDVARLLLMVPVALWQNSTPFFGAAAFCTTKIDDFRASMTSPLRSLRWPRSKVGDVEQHRHWGHWGGPARRDK